ncbi:MAG TPA: transcriptional regulator [Bacillota bacterium]|jgi:transcriptional regulator with XRE-family HTH domain|nr:transcriptional regulator [Bacillota bacterium]HQE66590.1 transcriptional regulator [Bacillota bacterium]HQI16703.1 transcriptional regulator [Bacillota bacterium]HQJ37927.1 transcriptional regulator [Bacillota bacterium]HQL37127.1 transcriptional regulator [Bacillota bacterium]
MDLVRIGEKVISIPRINNKINEILQYRMLGMSQQEAADKLGVERTFISRLEGLGEIRKGQSIAAIGFPIKNKTEVENVLRAFGVEYFFLMSEAERTDYVNNCSGAQLTNRIIELVNKLRSFDTVIVMASDYRNRLARDLLDNKVIEIDIGKSPIKKDVNVNLDNLTDILKTLKG